MSRKSIKILHLLGLALFLGSIPAHILLGRLAASADLAGIAVLLHAKHVSVLALTLPGLAVVILTGMGLLAGRRDLVRARWMRAKLVLAVLVLLNGTLLLAPTGADIAAAAAEAAASGTMPAALAVLQARESLFGTVNLVMILGITALAVLRPALRQRKAATTSP